MSISTLVLLVSFFFLSTFSSLSADYVGGTPDGNVSGGDYSPNDSSGIGGGGGATGNGNSGEWGSGHFDCNDQGGCNTNGPEPGPPPPQPGVSQVTGKVWYDLNGDQFWANEPITYNKKVVLVGINGILSAYSGIAGDYWFANLQPGSFSVNLFAPPGYTNTTAQSVLVTLPPDRVVNFGLKPIPPNIYLPEASCEGPVGNRLPRLTIPVDGWVRATRYDVYRIQWGSNPAPVWFTNIGTNPALGVWYSGDPLGRFYVHDDTVNPSLDYAYFVRSYNNRWTTWNIHPVDSFHILSDFDVRELNYQGTVYSGWGRPIPLAACNPPPPLSATFRVINTQPPDVTYNLIDATTFIGVMLNTPTRLEWTISNADSASYTVNLGTPSPITLSAGGASGSYTINTSVAGPVRIDITAQNSAETVLKTAQITVLNSPPAYFKTTGGDVHTNETIYITPQL